MIKVRYKLRPTAAPGTDLLQRQLMIGRWTLWTTSWIVMPNRVALRVGRVLTAEQTAKLLKR